MRVPAYDVAIVGFGPSGAVAAGLLAAQGLSVYVCDRSKAVYDKPRAIALDHEIMRVFQQLGVAERIEPYTEPFTDSCHYGMDGQLIRRMSTVPPPYPLGYNPSIVFSQPPVETILREHAQALPGVTVALGTTLTGLEQSVEDVRLRVRDEGGEHRDLHTRYLIACDGASSTVRELAGIELEDLGFDQPWLVVDAHVNEKGLARLPKESAQYCEPERPCTYIIGPGNHRRWEISINEGEDPAQLATPEGTWPLLSRWLSPDEGSLWRQASYRFHALVATRWRVGRVFVAGDAAHQQPPFLGQGMCQGVRDVANLSWKLAAVLRGEAGKDLLDTYGTERKAHVIELTTRIKNIGRMIGLRDPNEARERDARLLADCGGAVKPTPRQDMQPNLVCGLLDVRPHPANGSLFPQPWILRDGKRVRMDTLSGTGWRIVIRQGAQVKIDGPALPIGATVVRLGSREFSEADGVLAAWLARHACSMALVRPDNYVYGVTKDASGVEAMLRTLASYRIP